MSNQGAVTVLIEIHATDGQEHEARDALLHAVRTSEKPGLISSTEYEDLADPGAFYAIQVWENAEAFRAHGRRRQVRYERGDPGPARASQNRRTTHHRLITPPRPPGDERPAFDGLIRRDIPARR